MFKIIITLGIAFMGAQLGKKVNLPIPFMLGSMLIVAIANIAIPEVIYMPTSVKVLTQAVTGTFIGQTIQKEDMIGFRGLLFPIAILIGIYAMFTLIMGVSLHQWFHFDWPTAFLVAVPGGVVDMSLVSYDLGASPSIVSIMQSSRLIFVLSVFPTLIKRIKAKSGISTAVETSMEATSESEKSLNKINARNTVLTLVIGLIGGFVGHFSGIPAGPLSFSLILVAILNVKTNWITLPVSFRRLAQLAAGALVGTSIHRSDIPLIGNLLGPIMFVMIGYIAVSAMISYLMFKTKKVDYISALFAASPGGASDMALIASEINCDTPKIAVIQVSRLVLVIVLFPSFVKLLLTILSQ